MFRVSAIFSLPFLLEINAAGGVWTKVLLLKGAEEGAVCLDGSPGAYYIRPPLLKVSERNWLVYWSGDGGLCAGDPDCASRSLTSLGSSRYWPDVLPNALPPGLSPESAALLKVPPFDAFTVVLVVHCDGTYFSGDNATIGLVDGRPLFFRGARLRHALLTELDPRGLGFADQVLHAGWATWADKVAHSRQPGWAAVREVADEYRMINT